MIFASLSKFHFFFFLVLLFESFLHYCSGASQCPYMGPSF
uniref:Uncharacterized protein n=1 Tax=Arundo donax TaxID=35708 RepID=A0A0A8Y4A4_ARUDO